MIHPSKLIISLVYILVFGVLLPNFKAPLLTYNDHPWDGIYFFLASVFLLWPYIRAGLFYFKSLTPIARLNASFLFSISSVAVLASVGFYFSSWLSIELVVVGGAVLLCLPQIKDSLVPDWAELRPSNPDIYLFLTCIVLTGLYIQPYISKGNHLIPDADSASLAQLSLYMQQSFPKVVTHINHYIYQGKIITPEAYILQPPSIASLISVFNLILRLDVARVLYLGWVFLPLSFFVAGAFSIRALFSYTGIIVTLAGALFLHTHQIHLAYTGGEIQEVITLALLFLGMHLLRLNRDFFAAMAMGFAVSYQPDLAFPMACGLFLYVLWTRPFKQFLKFTGVYFIPLIPFLAQQIILKVAGVETVAFLKGYQLLVTPQEFLGQFRQYLPWYGLSVALMLWACVKRKENWKLYLSLIGAFSFFCFYPWVLHWITPQYSELNGRHVFPFNTVGTFKDWLFPFTGKYYLYRQGMSWFMVFFGMVGVYEIISWIKNIEIKQTVAGALGIYGIVALGYSYHKQVLMLPAVANHAVVKTLSDIADKYPLKKSILTSPATGTYSKFHGYHNWWIGPVLGVPSSDNRSEVALGSMYYKIPKGSVTLKEEFWKYMYAKDSPEVAQKRSYYGKLLGKVYGHMLIQQDSTRICERIAALKVWKFAGAHNFYCMFQAQ